MKQEDSIYCPSTIVLPNGSTYTLNSVINHIGKTVKSGHYNIVVQDESNSKYVLLDDLNISEDKLDSDTSKLSYVLTYLKNK